MPAPDLLLGLDVGTSSLKALLIDPAGAGDGERIPGRVVAEESCDYPVSTPRPMWSEQDPYLWWEATCRVLRRLADRRLGGRGGSLLERVAAVGLTGQMHGLVLLDGRGRLLRPAILWNDQRTAEQCVQITQRVGAQRVLELTGNPVLTGFTAPKIAWVRQHEPDLFSRAAHLLLPKDYLRYRLTGEICCDVSDASGTALFDVGRRQWSQEMIEAVGIPPGWLPQVTESPVVSSRISPAASAETGLRAGTPVVAGAGDQAAQALGTGIVREGLVSITLGTSGVVFAASDHYRVDAFGRLHAFCHAVPGMWHLMGVMLSAGGSFEWFCTRLGSREWLTGLDRDRRESSTGNQSGPGPETGGEPQQRRVADEAGGRSVYEVLIQRAASIAPGCEGLIFLPYLAGERTPHADPFARGVFFGLTLRHDIGALARAVMEGVGFGLRDSWELLRELGISPAHVRASGGGARSGLWRQILADILDVTVASVNVTAGAAYGAALLAGVGVGMWKSVPEAADAAVRVTGETAPGPARRVYPGYYERYRALYPALKAEFAALAGVAAQQGRA